MQCATMQCAARIRVSAPRIAADAYRLHATSPVVVEAGATDAPPEIGLPIVLVVIPSSFLAGCSIG